MTSYADDTSISVSHRILAKIIEMLEEDAQNILEFMASNGLVANASKTAFMVLNHKQDLTKSPITINIGTSKVKAESSAKLLGMALDSNQKWNSQIKGDGGTINALNSRLYLLRRIGRAVDKNRLKKVADSLYTSKLRYGVQLFGKVRTKDSDKTDGLLESLQVTQNKFARFMHGSTLADKINNNVIYKESNLLSVNQINASIKLLEVWKSMNDTAYPIKWIKRRDDQQRLGLKSSNKPDITIKSHSKIQSGTFFNDAAQIWNDAPVSIKECKSIYAAKKNIKSFVKLLPI